jgi:hypothetical protein
MYRTLDPEQQEAARMAAQLEAVAARGQSKIEALARAGVERERRDAARVAEEQARARPLRYARSLTRAGLLAELDVPFVFMGVVCSGWITVTAVAYLTEGWLMVLRVVMGGATLFWPVGVILLGKALVRLRAPAEQRLLDGLPFRLDSYAGTLEAPDVVAVRVTLGFAGPPPGADLVRGLLADAGVVAEVGERGAVLVTPRPPSFFDHANHPVHVWFRRLATSVLVPLRGAYPFDVVTVRACEAAEG